MIQARTHFFDWTWTNSARIPWVTEIIILIKAVYLEKKDIIAKMVSYTKGTRGPSTRSWEPIELGV